jgi:hypothetical protein
MIVNRWVYHVKPGRREELVALLRSIPSLPEATRFCRPEIGAPLNIVEVEATFDSLGEYERALGQMTSDPGFPALAQKIDDLLAGDANQQEIWTVIE